MIRRRQQQASLWLQLHQQFEKLDAMQRKKKRKRKRKMEKMEKRMETKEKT